MINNILDTIKPLSKEQRMELLYAAKILDENGNYHPDFFSKETIEKDKERKQITE
jgi:hypothetical protein